MSKKTNVRTAVARADSQQQMGMHTAALGRLIGEWLTREERSMRWLSRKTGVSASQICRLINGAETSFGKCAIISKTCGISMDAAVHTDELSEPPTK